MAIPIIGRSGAEPVVETQLLPTPEVDLPPPDSVPEAKPVLDEQRLAALLEHPHPLVRNFVLERFLHEPDPARHMERIARLIDDPEPSVAVTALRGAAETQHAPALEQIVARFGQASGEVAAQAASALARIAPDRLVEEVKKRSRLDDLAYFQTMTALARSESPGAVEYLGRSMNRAGALPAERRAALYSAVLLGGSSELSARVVSLAVSDSRSNEGPTPARVALASIGSLPPSMARVESADTVFLAAKEMVDASQGWLSPEEREALEDAIKKKNAGKALATLVPFLDREPTQGIDADQASIVRRRKAFLKALLDQREAVATLDANLAAIFVSAGIGAAQLVALATIAADQSPGVVALAKNMSLEPAALIALSTSELASRFAQEGERRMRQFCGVLSQDAVVRLEVLEKILTAIVEAGGGTVLIDSAASSEQEVFQAAALRSLIKKPSLAESIAREALERRPLEEGPARLALTVAARVGTERLALTIGRRFFDLRKVARHHLADAVIHLGDLRLIPLIESRAFPGEPEEIAWAMLSLLRGDPVEGRLKEALDRHTSGPAPREIGETDDGIRVPLKCKRCTEELVYEVKRIYVDPKSDAPDGDPAYVGDVACKACGAVDQFEATSEAVQLMSESMLRLLGAARAGMAETPRVIPRSIRIAGKELGLSRALREADRGVQESPDSIRARLRRARLRLVLWRSSAREDAEKVLEIDPRSPEAAMLLGGTLAQKGELEKARDELVRALGLLEAEEQPRLYESDEKNLRLEVEDALVEIEENGVEIPAEVDIEDARRRRDTRLEKQAQRMEELELRMRVEAGQARQKTRSKHESERPAFLRTKD
jgi:hypothetical protein